MYYVTTNCPVWRETILNLWENWNAPVVDIPDTTQYNKTYTKLVRTCNPYTATWSLLPITGVDYETMYRRFRVPKHNGGYREIKAPNATLKEIQQQILKELDKHSWYVHDSAYAYVHKRSAKHALQQHQANQSEWFLKLDIKRFFDSCTKRFVCDQMMKLYPYCVLFSDAAALGEALAPCFAEGCLPQGAPTSPKLTNLIMIPIDYKITVILRNLHGNHYVYTRYADDILISCKEKFNPVHIINIINHVFEDTPFHLNTDKTRFGSIRGQNWNLGLMLNSENKITVGNQRKRQLKVALHNFTTAYNNNTIDQWDLTDLYHLQGELSYVKSIEPEAAFNLCNKFPLIEERIKAVIKQRVI